MKARFKLPSLIVCLLIFAAACAAPRSGKSNNTDLDRVVRSVRGRVLDQNGGAIEGAEVRALAYQRIDILEDQCRTDERGNFTIRLRGHAPEYTIEFHSPHHAPKVYSDFTPGLSDMWFGNIILKEPARVKGLVLGPDGKPAPNIQIYALSASRPFDAMREPLDVLTIRSDASGEFIINNLPAERIYIGGGSDELGDALLIADPPTGDVEDVILQLPGGPPVRGRVEDTISRPVRGATIELYGGRMIAPWREPCVSDIDGYFTFWPIRTEDIVANGIYTTAPNGSCNKSWDEFVADPVLKVPANPTTTTVRVDLPRGALPPDATIFWTDVEDSLGGFPSSVGPLPFGLPSLLQFDGKSAIVSFGVFQTRQFMNRTINLEFENFKIVLVASNGAVFETDLIQRTPEPSPIPAVFAARPVLTKTVKLQIVDEAGRPVVDFHVLGKLHRTNRSWTGHYAITNKSGEFTFNLEGDINDNVSMDISGGSRDLILEKVRFPAKSILEKNPPALIARRGARVSGTVMIDGRRPTQPIFVRIESLDSYYQNSEPGFMNPVLVSVDREGNFMSDALPPGKLRIIAFTPNDSFNPRDIILNSRAQEISVGRDEEKDVVIDVPKDQSATVAVSVQFDGRPLGNCNIIVRGSGADTNVPPNRTTAAGKCNIKLKNGGDYEFTVTHLGRVFHKKATIHDGESANVVMDFKLSETANFSLPTILNIFK